MGLWVGVQGASLWWFFRVHYDVLRSAQQEHGGSFLPGEEEEEEDEDDEDEYESRSWRR